mmetsp:Transcript_63098/g.199653  ORF Transcript_63098/g.199653 Transcript_63098/m.199653 type:complete len:212 (+) Transcript_63098:185-820(+)
MGDASGSFDGGLGEVDGGAGLSQWTRSRYKPIPTIYWISFVAWTLVLAAWSFANFWKRGRQISNLQRLITFVPCIKFPVLALSFGFWLPCTQGIACNSWIAFGILCFRVFLEVAYFVVFLLIAHGWCITRASLTRREARSIAATVGVLYLSLAGFNIWSDLFILIVIGMYCVLVALVFWNIQVTHTKHSMFLRFRVLMALLAASEALIHTL